MITGHVCRLHPGSRSQLALHCVSVQPARLAFGVNKLDDGVLIGEVQRCVACGEDRGRRSSGYRCLGRCERVRGDGGVERLRGRRGWPGRVCLGRARRSGWSPGGVGRPGGIGRAGAGGGWCGRECCRGGRGPRLCLGGRGRRRLGLGVGDRRCEGYGQGLEKLTRVMARREVVGKNIFRRDRYDGLCCCRKDGSGWRR